MASHRLRERVRFERRVATAGDGAGNTLPETWTPFYICAGRLRPINGREEVLAQKLGGVQPFELVVRCCRQAEQVTTDDRAVNDRTGAPYDITAIQNPDERRSYLSMLVRAGVADG